MQVNAGSPETVTYLHTDHLGTPKFGTSAAGAQVWAWAPDSFGNGTPTGSATVNLRMPGQYFDAESGIFYNWNRYYNPEIGRYISSDPIGLEGGMNTFLYAGANPVMAMDQEGLMTRCFTGSYDMTCPSRGNLLAGGAAGGANTSAQTKGLLQQMLNAARKGSSAGQAASVLSNESSESGSSGACPSPEELRGKTPEEVDKIMKEKGWQPEPSKSGGGTRYPSPDKKGEQVRIQPGYPSNPDPMKRGPYAVISKGGDKFRVPLANNPLLPE